MDKLVFLEFSYFCDLFALNQKVLYPSICQLPVEVETRGWGGGNEMLDLAFFFSEVVSFVVNLSYVSILETIKGWEFEFFQLFHPPMDEIYLNFVEVDSEIYSFHGAVAVMNAYDMVMIIDVHHDRGSALPIRSIDSMLNDASDSLLGRNICNFSTSSFRSGFLDGLI